MPDISEKVSKKPRIGILGGGGILGAHGPAFVANADRCSVVMVAEPNENCHARIRELLGEDVEIVPDYHDVLADGRIDAVDILLPHYLHMPATVDAAEAGKPVLTEKVMARNVWECDRMIEACETAGVSLTVCHDRRYHGQWEALKEIVDSGALGEIFFWKLDHNQDVVFPEGTWVRTRDGIGGGCIMSCLTHQIDALRWYAGEFGSLSCMTRVTPDRMEGESLGVIIATLASGALAELSINWRTRSNVGDNCLWYEMVHACGTEGEAYYMSNREGTFIRLHENADREAIDRYGEAALEAMVPVECAPHAGHRKCITEWVKMIAGDEADIRTSGRECRGTVEVAEAAYRAVEERRVVSLPIEPRPWVESAGPVDVGRTDGASYHIEM
ncbi:MAG: Gfo/Idh/MocA family oxidoreductase [Candidatus Latescibacteria bacterium]|nr:Gfo/Idh/MocA family oxidoreductase [Candidatus Latescibacterota bacterium]